jgi:hypothetical protein
MERLKGERKLIKVFSATGLFHCWGIDYEEFENDSANYSTAIVEMEDGTVQTPRANMIKFND